MHVARLARIAAILDTVPDEQFDLTLWDCHSAACAIGHACRDPELQAQGLQNNFSRFPVFRNWIAFPAVQAFLGINRDDALFLFAASSYPAKCLPQQVADRIRGFIAAAQSKDDGS